MTPPVFDHRSPDDRHVPQARMAAAAKALGEELHYGHQRFETATSLMLGLLLGVGVGMVWSAVMRVQNPGTLQQVHVIALWVALVTLVLNKLLFRCPLRGAKRVKSSKRVANAWHARSDAAWSLAVAMGMPATWTATPTWTPLRRWWWA